MRSDRFGSIFSLLTLTFPTPCDDSELALMAGVFHSRLRETDDAGHLAPDCLGIVLPETPPEGAWKLAGDLLRMFPSAARRPQCAVYAYPEPTQHDDPPKNGSSPGDRIAGRRRTCGAATQGAVTNGSSGRTVENVVKPMNALLMQPLPAWKRAIDVLGAGAALTLSAPLLLLTAVMIKLTSRGPVFYSQMRDGQGGRRFWIHKFRTMVVDAEAMKSQLRPMSQQDGPAFKLKNDPRVTPFGRLLRRTCVDELPQLFNVLKGDMSLVGPRPMCSKEAAHCSQWQRRRLDVTPGLTCTWQVYGGAKTTFVDWMRMDLRYIGSRTLWKDLRLMALTIPSIIRRDGVY